MKITRILKSMVVATVIAGALLLAPTAAYARVFVSVGFAPPAIPVYEQPLAPGYGYIWTPGYWAYGDSGYYWVDGAWVYPPYVDALWTPGYWGWGYNLIGFRIGYVYNHPVAGFNGRPGGESFARNEGSFNRGATNNISNRGGFGTNGASRGEPNGARSFAGNQTQARSFTGSQPQARSFSGGNSAAHSNFSSGGGSRGFSGGGGGGFHGGGGGGHGGGGHR
jgi:hypothetical protein